MSTGADTTGADATGADATGPDDTVATIALPAFGAGSVDVPWAVNAFDDAVDRDTSWLPHSHPTHELLWNERGASRVTVDNRIWTVTPSVGVWIPAGVLHSASTTAGTWYRATHFDVRRVSPLAERPVSIEITPLLKMVLLRLADEALSAESRSIAEAMALDVLTPSGRELVVAVPASPWLRPIVQALQANPGDRRLLDDWAQELGATPRTITRAFQRETGLAFGQWVSVLRACHAIEMLAGGSDPEDVAAHVGYATVSAFGAAFKRATGVTPSAFRVSVPR
ncbi:AraC family transcriptional regulator [Microbacterium sp. NPDC089320]|uniref:helix-turn-helix domain-containing protein n=1 Tax=Microbacterium sp. NPDC089320 TaxID=3155182 RepID=UPI00343F589F